MYLNNKQFASLTLPFVVSIAVYIYSAEIVSYANYLFPAQEKYSNVELNAKIDTYLQIEREIEKYKEIQQKIDLRREDARWVAQNLFYQKQQNVEVGSGKEPQKIEIKQFSYKLQAIFFDTKTAIINNLIVKEGSLIEDAAVTKIEKNRVQIKTKKGLKWLTIFH